jgi:hypothetical protein
MSSIAVIPKNFLFRFSSRRCGGLPSDKPQDGDTWTYNFTPSIPGIGLGTETVHESALALFAPNAGTPNNAAQLEALAEQFATDYLNWRLAEFDESFVGIVAVKPNALIDTLEFDYSNDRCATRIYTGEYVNSFQQLMHQIDNPDANCPDVDSQHVSSRYPCFEVFGPPTPVQTSGHTTFNQYLICKENGRYKKKFIGSVVYDCGCQPPSVSAIFCVIGCGSVCSEYGVTVSVYDAPGGTLLASGVTSSSGADAGTVTLTWTGGTSPYWVTVTGQNARFNSYAGSFITGGIVNIRLTAASGYTCTNCCDLPIKNLLMASIVPCSGIVFPCGPQAMTWVSGQQWTSSALGLGVNFSSGIPNAGGAWGSFPVSFTCPPAFNLVFCTGGTLCAGMGGSTLTVTE